MEIFPGRQLGREGWGLVYLFTMNPGAIRGNHYHQSKNEWFFLAQGAVELLLRDITAQNNTVKTLTATKPEVVAIPAGTAHTLKNSHSDPALIIAYIDQEFDPNQPDTYPMNLI